MFRLRPMIIHMKHSIKIKYDFVSCVDSLGSFLKLSLTPYYLITSINNERSKKSSKFALKFKNVANKILHTK